MITQDKIKAAEQVLIDNGIEPDEADTVLQAIGYVLLDTELYDDCLPRAYAEIDYDFVSVDEITGTIGEWLDRDIDEIPPKAILLLQEAYDICAKEFERGDDENATSLEEETK